jgi:coenzyme F420-reducing hydrogenase delta subunit
MYPTAEERLSVRVDQAKQVLDEIGMSGERIDFWRTKDAAEVCWSAFWEFSKRKLAMMDSEQRGGES